MKYFVKYVITSGKVIAFHKQEELEWPSQNEELETAEITQEEFEGYYTENYDLLYQNNALIENPDKNYNILRIDKIDEASNYKFEVEKVTIGTRTINFSINRQIELYYRAKMVVENTSLNAQDSCVTINDGKVYLAELEQSVTASTLLQWLNKIGCRTEACDTRFKIVLDDLRTIPNEELESYPYQHGYPEPLVLGNIPN